MIFATILFAMLVTQGPVIPHQADGLQVSQQMISLDIPDLTLKDAICDVFNQTHMKYRFDPEAEEVATNLHRTASFRGVSVNVALFQLLSNAVHAGMVLSVRRDGDVFVLSQPILTFNFKNASPREAIDGLLARTGCDYCADVSEMGTKKISLSVTGVPLSETFQQLMHKIAPKKSYQLVFRHGCYLVMTTEEAVHVHDFDTRPVVARIYSHSRADAIAAVCDCFHRSYIFSFDGPVYGMVDIGPEVKTSGQLIRNILSATPYALTANDTEDVIIIYRSPPGPQGPL